MSKDKREDAAKKRVNTARLEIRDNGSRPPLNKGVAGQPWFRHRSWVSSARSCSSSFSLNRLDQEPISGMRFSYSLQRLDATKYSLLHLAETSFNASTFAVKWSSWVPISTRSVAIGKKNACSHMLRIIKYSEAIMSTPK